MVVDFESEAEGFEYYSEASYYDDEEEAVDEKNVSMLVMPDVESEMGRAPIVGGTNKTLKK